MQRPISLVGVGIFVIFTACFAFMFGGASLPLQAQATGTINGLVTGDNAQPLANIRVNIYRRESFTGIISWNDFSSTMTDVSGTYTFTGLEDGGYRIGFQPQESPRTYFPEFYDNAAQVWEGATITVTAGSTINNINAQLSSGAHIKGRVTGPAGEPLRDIRVTAFGNSATPQVMTDADGRYDINGLEAGEYQVLFEDTREPARYAREYFDNADFENRTPVTVATEQIRTGIDAQLDQLAVVVGSVTDAQSNPLANITVVAELQETDTTWSSVGYGYTDASGTYSITGLYAGTYRIWFRDNAYGRYSQEWYDDSLDPATATPLTLTLNTTTTGINAQLIGRGAITGMVTDADNNPVADIQVYTEYIIPDSHSIWSGSGSTTTDSNGHYTICCLNPQAYRVSFGDYNQHYITEYYDGVLYPDAAGPETVTMVQVTATMTTTGINASLLQYGKIIGRVTDDDGLPASQTEVKIYRQSPLNDTWEHIYSSYPDNEGYYQQEQLFPGTYRIGVFGAQEPPHYTGEFYNDVNTLESATDILVTQASTVTINFTLAAKARIAGMVTDKENNPLSNIDVGVYQFSTVLGEWIQNFSTTTNKQGLYVVSGLSAGMYRIGFFEHTTYQYISEYYNDVATVDDAQTLTLAENQLLNNINAQLAKLGEIHGSVTNQNNEPLPYIAVIAERYTDQGDNTFEWQYAGSTDTDENGKYKLLPLKPGEYRLQVLDYNGIYQGEWYNNQGYATTATSLQIQDDQVLRDINIQLAAEPFTWPPFAQNDEIVVNEGGTASALSTGVENLVANDYNDRGSLLQTTIVANPMRGALTLNSDGTFTYQHDGSESTTDHFTYRANDGVQQSNIATVTVTIQPINDLPTAVDDTVSVVRGQSISRLSSGAASVLANDSDPDDSTLTVTVTTQPQHGTLTLNSDGTFVYTHNGDTATSDSFGYKATDGLGASDTATVTITITEPAGTSFTFSKTVGIQGIKPACTLADEMKVPVETTIVYCYTVRNTGDVPLTTHSLVDSHLGQLLSNVSHTLAPGAIYSTTFTQTLTITTTNVATWTASAGNGGQRLAPTAPTMETAATVRISGPNDDADGDTIPDNLERAGDIDEDNIPNFLDTDADGDGVSDRDEVGSNPRSPIDSDSDGIPDYLDDDSQPSTTRKILLPIIRR